MSGAITTAARSAYRELTGVVVSAGLASKTVKVRVGGVKWEKRVQKFFKKPDQLLVHDPNNSLRQGDIVAIESGWVSSKNKRHVVRHIIAPFGTPIEERPQIPAREELLQLRQEKKEAKDERRAARKEAESRTRAAEKETKKALIIEKTVQLKQQMKQMGEVD